MMTPSRHALLTLAAVFPLLGGAAAPERATDASGNDRRDLVAWRRPVAVVVTDGGRWIWTANRRTGTLTVVDGATLAVRAERAVNRALGGSCTIPLGAYAQASNDTLHLRALVASPDGKRIARAEGEGRPEQPEALGLRVAGLLRERGADEILAALVK